MDMAREKQSLIVHRVVLLNGLLKPVPREIMHTNKKLGMGNLFFLSLSNELSAHPSSPERHHSTITLFLKPIKRTGRLTFKNSSAC
jgi:hypothetical protein